MPKITKLENYVVERLKEIFPDTLFSKNSGGGKRNSSIADITNSILAIECKQRKELKNYNFKKDEWQKLCNELPINSEKIPIFIKGTNDLKDIKVILNFNDFLEILKEKIL